MAKAQNPWKTISGKEIYENPWIKLTEYQVINPSGGKGIYGKVAFKGKAIGILPIDEEGNTWLVGQYRYTLDEYSWEIPMGGVPFDEPTEVGALRELKEETGIVAKKLEFLAKVHTSNSVTDEVGAAYLATQLTFEKPDFEETEDISILKMPFSQALDWVMEGKITDSISMIAILKYAKIQEQHG
jgi:8-oxo-dGTP pyrophosphatase MutT (NUDIX family)